MRKTRILILIIFALFLTKLIVVGIENYEIMVLPGFGLRELIKEPLSNLPLYFRKGLIFETFLIVISITGLFIRNTTGWIITLIFPFAIVGYGILYVSALPNIWGEFQIYQLLYGYLLILLLNLPITKEYFSEIGLKKTIMGNALSFVLGIGIMFCIVNIGMIE